MTSETQNPLTSIANGFVAYLPNLLSGIGLVLLGVLCGWFVKKILIQLAILARLDRLFSRTRWKEEIGKADVRHGLYALIGNFGFFLILLLFVDNAFIAWKLTILSDLLSRGIVFLPRLVLAGVIFGAGWLVSAWMQRSVLRTLVGESVERPTLIARFVRSVAMLFFSAMALVELDVAREIVIIGFTTIFLSLGALAVIFVVRQGKSMLGEPERKEYGDDDPRAGGGRTR